MINKSISRQFVIWMILLTGFILSGSMIVFLIQSNEFSKYSRKQEQLKEKYTYTEAIEDAFNQSFFDSKAYFTLEEPSFLDKQHTQQKIIEDQMSRMNQIAY